MKKEWFTSIALMGWVGVTLVILFFPTLGPGFSWLKVAETSNGVKTVWAESARPRPRYIEGTQDGALFKENLDGGANDARLAAAMRYFGLGAEAFID